MENSFGGTLQIMEAACQTSQRNEHIHQQISKNNQNLKLASQLWSRAIHVTNSNQSIYYTTEY